MNFAYVLRVLNSFNVEEFDDLLSPWAEVARSERTL